MQGSSSIDRRKSLSKDDSQVALTRLREQIYTRARTRSLGHDGRKPLSAWTQRARLCRWRPQTSDPLPPPPPPLPPVPWTQLHSPCVAVSPGAADPRVRGVTALRASGRSSGSSGSSSLAPHRGNVPGEPGGPGTHRATGPSWLRQGWPECSAAHLPSDHRHRRPSSEVGGRSHS